jgi:hypothetical protein
LPWFGRHRSGSVQRSAGRASRRRALLFDLGDVTKLAPPHLLRLTDIFVAHAHMELDLVLARADEEDRLGTQVQEACVDPVGAAVASARLSCPGT